MCIMKRRIKISMILNFCKFVCRVIFFPYLQTEPKISLSRIVLGRIQFGISVWFWELFDKSLKFNFSGFGPRFGTFLAEQVQRSGFFVVVESLLMLDEPEQAYIFNIPSSKQFEVCYIFGFNPPRISMSRICMSMTIDGLFWIYMNITCEMGM